MKRTRVNWGVLGAADVGSTVCVKTGTQKIAGFNGETLDFQILGVPKKR